MEITQHLGDREMSFLARAVNLIFGEDTYCVHGTKGSDGVCMDCCNDMYESDEDELAEVIDFPTDRDTI